MSETMAGWPGAPRFRFEQGQGETIVHMPMYRPFGHIFRIAALTLVMAVGGPFAYVLSIAGPRDPLFYQVWLTLWAIAMSGLFGYLVYTLFGSDRLIIRRNGASRVRALFGIPYRQDFNADEARAFKFVSRDPTIRYKVGKTRISTSALVLANRDRYVSIARRLSAKEAQDIIDAIAFRLGSGGRDR